MSESTTTVERTAPRLKAKYNAEIRATLQQQLGLANVMQVPALEKIVINMGVGRATQQPSLLEGAVVDLTAIAGQKPIVTKAKHSIAGFKLREGQAIGTKVTLRGDRMWEFLDRLIAVAIPRIRDFRGLPPTSWDGRGNYTFGLNDQTVFPEIDYDKIDTPRGWTSRSSPRRPTMPPARPCWTPSGSRSGRPTTPTLPHPSSAAAAVARSAARGSSSNGQESTDQQGGHASPSSRCAPTPVAGAAAGRAPCSASSACAGCAYASSPTPARSLV